MQQEGRVHNLPHTKGKRRALRTDATPQEVLIWSRVRDSQLGYKFKRQYGIGPYIADFYCAHKKLIIEIDGSQHYEPQEEAYDRERTAFLNDRGCTVLRFSNAEVNTNLEGVMMNVCDALNGSERQPSPQPSPDAKGNPHPNPLPKGEGENSPS